MRCHFYDIFILFLLLFVTAGGDVSSKLLAMFKEFTVDMKSDKRDYYKGTTTSAALYQKKVHDNTIRKGQHI